MSLLSRLLELIESLFHSNGEDSKQKSEIRKIEAELKALQPAIYKNREALPNLAEVFRNLQINLLPIKHLLDNTIASQDLKRKSKYINMLIETGFSDKAKESLAELSYENRKSEFFEAENQQKVRDIQQKKLDSVLRELSTAPFRDIETTLLNLELLADLCNFPYTSLIREFDKSYNVDNVDAEFRFVPIPIEILEQYLQDFYFLSSVLAINGSVGRALVALDISTSTVDYTEEKREQLLGHVRKIYAIFSKILTTSTVKSFIRVIKNDAQYEPKVVKIKPGNVIKYSDFVRKQFEKENEQITIEVQDEHIESEIKELFNGVETILVDGYNAENSETFFRTGVGSFLWTTPIHIIKNFLQHYFNAKVQALLNDLVVEGFFTNPQYKTDYSSAVFACVEAITSLKDFEASFNHGGKNDLTLMIGYVQDSNKDSSFITTLIQMIDAVNKESKKLIQEIVSKIFSLSKILEELIPDARRNTPEKIENLHVLFTSPRNRDNFEFLETTFPMWNIFLEIMRNYAIIGDVRSE